MHSRVVAQSTAHLSSCRLVSVLRHIMKLASRMVIVPSRGSIGSQVYIVGWVANWMECPAGLLSAPGSSSYFCGVVHRVEVERAELGGRRAEADGGVEPDQHVLSAQVTEHVRDHVIFQAKLWRSRRTGCELWRRALELKTRTSRRQTRLSSFSSGMWSGWSALRRGRI